MPQFTTFQWAILAVVFFGFVSISSYLKGISQLLAEIRSATQGIEMNTESPADASEF